VIRYVEAVKADPYATPRAPGRVARDPFWNGPLGHPHGVPVPEAGRDDLHVDVRRVSVHLAKKSPRKRNRAGMERAHAEEKLTLAWSDSLLKENRLRGRSWTRNWGLSP
jgi:hypothetical protein